MEVIKGGKPRIVPSRKGKGLEGEKWQSGGEEWAGGNSFMSGDVGLAGVKKGEVLCVCEPGWWRHGSELQELHWKNVAVVSRMIVQRGGHLLACGLSRFYPWHPIGCPGYLQE